MWAQKKLASGAMRVRLLVGELMMPAMDGDPARGCFLEAGDRDDHHGVLQPFRTFQPAVGEKPVIAKVDAKQPAQMCAEHGYEQAAPAEIAGHKGQQRDSMIGADSEYVGPVELERPDARGQHQPPVCCDGSGVIRGGQHRGLYRWQTNWRHSEAGIPISARDAVRLNGVIPDQRINRV
jgi:hypothetical protein